MENNYQEKILSSIIDNYGLEVQYSNYEIMSRIRDCFAITRIQNEIAVLSRHAAFNNGPQQEREKKYEELDKILSKYPNALEITKE